VINICYVIVVCNCHLIVLELPTSENNKFDFFLSKLPVLFYFLRQEKLKSIEDRVEEWYKKKSNKTENQNS